MTKRELIKILSCVDDDTELFCSFDSVEQEDELKGFLTSVSLSFSNERAYALLNIREVRVSDELVVA